MTTFRQIQSAPPALVTARGAIAGLGQLFSIVDPSAWASMARPDAENLAQLVHAIGGKFDEGLAEMGFEPAPPGPRTLD